VKRAIPESITTVGAIAAMQGLWIPALAPLGRNDGAALMLSGRGPMLRNLASRELRAKT
jgi:hypothetical protein